MIDPTAASVNKIEDYALNMVQILDKLGYESCVYVCMVEKDTGEGSVVGCVSEGATDEMIKMIPHEIAAYNEHLIFGNED